MFSSIGKIYKKRNDTAWQVTGLGQQDCSRGGRETRPELQVKGLLSQKAGSSQMS